MAVSMTFSDLDYARLKFEELMTKNNHSTRKLESGEYYYQLVQNMWVTFKVGFREGALAQPGGSCEF